MRIKAVLRDGAILQITPGSEDRIVAAAKKNLNRLISMTSLLKVMGLNLRDRSKMLDTLSYTKLHVWLGIDSEQHVIYISESEMPQDFDLCGYKWQ
ncbi:hypothetical protein KAR91_86010 [Candidatus Pacearchaeota archaeon]|nr:hypothetical protein [Candidatus Pacearchaeota archaeon]